MKVKTCKGFTLAELLIVMAIIVVLAAVAIPSFGKQLETARESADLEEIRNAYTEMYALAVRDSLDGTLLGNDKGTVGKTAAATGAFVKAIDFKQGTAGWQYLTPNVGGSTVTSDTDQSHTQVTFTFELDEDGDMTLNSVVTGTAD